MLYWERRSKVTFHIANSHVWQGVAPIYRVEGEGGEMEDTLLCEQGPSKVLLDQHARIADSGHTRGALPRSRAQRRTCDCGKLRHQLGRDRQRV